MLVKVDVDIMSGYYVSLLSVGARTPLDFKKTEIQFTQELPFGRISRIKPLVLSSS
jgi:hypothetical protein